MLQVCLPSVLGHPYLRLGQDTGAAAVGCVPDMKCADHNPRHPRYTTTRSMSSARRCRSTWPATSPTSLCSSFKLPATTQVTAGCGSWNSNVQLTIGCMQARNSLTTFLTTRPSWPASTSCWASGLKGVRRRVLSSRVNWVSCFSVVIQLQVYIFVSCEARAFSCEFVANTQGS